MARKTTSSTAEEPNNPGPDSLNHAPKESNSIVPSKYAGRYGKDGGDALSKFINDHSKNGEGKFSFEMFFDLVEKNGVDPQHVKPYREALDNNLHGAQGRARMTLRNRLDAIVRKNGNKIKDHGGGEHELELAAKTPSRPPQRKKGGDLGDAAAKAEGDAEQEAAEA